MRLPMKHTESCFSNYLSLPTIPQRYHEPVTTLVNQPKCKQLLVFCKGNLCLCLTNVANFWTRPYQPMHHILIYTEVKHQSFYELAKAIERKRQKKTAAGGSSHASSKRRVWKIPILQWNFHPKIGIIRGSLSFGPLKSQSRFCSFARAHLRPVLGRKGQRDHHL